MDPREIPDTKRNCPQAACPRCRASRSGFTEGCAVEGDEVADAVGKETQPRSVPLLDDMAKSRRSLNLIAMGTVGMFAGVAGTGVTPFEAAAPLQSALLAIGIGAGLVLILAPLWPDRVRSVSRVAALIAVVMFLALAGTLGTAMTWLQAAFVVLGVVQAVWAAREATKDAEPEDTAIWLDSPDVTVESGE